MGDNKLKPMTKQDVWDVATEAVFNYIKSEGYQIEGVNPKCNSYPNIVFKKDDKLYGVLIDANEVRKQPDYSIKGTFDMMKFSRRFNAIPLYASVGIGSANPERFEKCELFDNDPDGYYVNFVDFDSINYDLVDKLSSNEIKEYIVNLFGDCYCKKDFSMIEKYMSDNCNWYSMYSGNKYSSKKEIINYYQEKVKALKSTEINYFLIKYVGSWFELKVSELTLPDGTKSKNATVKMPQPDGEIGLIIEQIKDDGEKVGMAVTIGFDDNNMINDIYIGDPYAMNFEDYYKINNEL